MKTPILSITADIVKDGARSDRGDAILLDARDDLCKDAFPIRGNFFSVLRPNAGDPQRCSALDIVILQSP